MSQPTYNPETGFSLNDLEPSDQITLPLMLQSTNISVAYIWYKKVGTMFQLFYFAKPITFGIISL